MDISLDYSKYRNEYTPKEIVDRFFKLPERFDENAGFVMGALESFYGQNIRENEGPTFDHLVDVGCGSGKQTLEFKRFFHRITAVDPSGTQIEMAVNTFPNTGNINFLVASAEDIPVDDASADVITAVWSFFYFEMDKFIKECQRVLKPQGAAVLFGYHPSKVEPGRKFGIGKKAEADATKVWERACSRLKKYWIEIKHPGWHVFDWFKQWYENIKSIKKSREEKQIEIEMPLSELRKYYFSFPGCCFTETKDIFEEFYKELKEQWQVQEMADDDVIIRLTNEIVIITLSK